MHSVAQWLLSEQAPPGDLPGENTSLAMQTMNSKFPDWLVGTLEAIRIWPDQYLLDMSAVLLRHLVMSEKKIPPLDGRTKHFGYVPGYFCAESDYYGIARELDKKPGPIPGKSESEVLLAKPLDLLDKSLMVPWYPTRRVLHFPASVVEYVFDEAHMMDNWRGFSADFVASRLEKPVFLSVTEATRSNPEERLFDGFMIGISTYRRHESSDAFERSLLIKAIPAGFDSSFAKWHDVFPFIAEVPLPVGGRLGDGLSRIVCNEDIDATYMKFAAEKDLRTEFGGLSIRGLRERIVWEALALLYGAYGAWEYGLSVEKVAHEYFAVPPAAGAAKKKHAQVLGKLVGVKYQKLIDQMLTPFVLSEVRYRCPPVVMN